MKISRVIIIIVVIIVIVIIALFAYEALVPSKSNSIWSSGSQYPLQAGSSNGVGGQQCVNVTSYIYCIGGEDVNSGPRDNVYTTNPLSSSGITGWAADSNSYPQTVFGESCFYYSGDVYCVGGTFDDSGDDIASSYYAPVSNGQVGTWTSTTSYVVADDTLSCVPYSGYVYCVAGTAESDGTNGTAASSGAVYYAPISSTGIGNWSAATSYPAGVYYPICYGSQGYIYCLGGTNNNGNSVSSVNSIYYASLSPSGVGAWTATTGYPLSLSGQSCVIVSGTIYCVGGQGDSGYSNAVYSAPVSSSGVGTWKQLSSYPDSAETVCAYSSGYIYCTGGFDGSSASETSQVNYVSLTSLASSTP